MEKNYLRDLHYLSGRVERGYFFVDKAHAWAQIPTEAADLYTAANAFAIRVSRAKRPNSPRCPDCADSVWHDRVVIGLSAAASSTAAAPLPTASPPPIRRARRVSAWLLLAGWCTLAAAWSMARAPSTWLDLEEAANRGEVAWVEVSDHAKPPALKSGQKYRSTVRVTWKQGWRTRMTHVVETTRHRRPEMLPLTHDQGTGLHRAHSEATARMRNVEGQLTTLAPDVPVRHSDDRDRPAELLGRHLPSWAAALSAATLLGSLAHLVLNRRPQRATRWAWFWLWCIPGVGVALYLLGSGATLGRPPTREPLRGWTAFVVCVVASVALGASLFA